MILEDFKRKYKYDQATPVMQQYLDVKARNIDCLLLFRMGDFYELFYEDALITARVLGITLTKRGKTEEEEIPMCGVPFHAVETYLHRLIDEGFKVAICEQLETPDEAKKRSGSKAVIRRDVTRIITPGTIIEESLLESSEPNYLCSVVVAGNKAGICYLDLSTSEVIFMELPEAEIINELSRIKPNEILLSEKMRLSNLTLAIGSGLDKMISFQVDSFFALAKCENVIKNFYKITSLDAIGTDSTLAISAIGGVLEYVNVTQKDNLPILPLPKIQYYDKFMIIDSHTRKNLEISSSQNGNKNTLFNVIDKTQTKAGSRLLYKYLSAPLIDVREINKRLDTTEFFLKYADLTRKIRTYLGKIGDLERCLTRFAMQRGTPQDLLSVKDTIATAEIISSHFLEEIGTDLPEFIAEIADPLLGNQAIYNLISEAILEDARNVLSDGNIIKHSYHGKVKELHDLINNSSIHVDSLREKYRKLTGVETLKISHNNVLGLFIEVTTRNAEKLTDAMFIHRQSTANTSRYTTIELQELESKIVNARQLVIALERQIYDEIVVQVLNRRNDLLSLANALSHVDLFCGFASKAEQNNYCRPEINDDSTLEIINGRHPVIEETLNKTGQSFIGNNCLLDFEKRIWLITGPNMSGKSTFLRQNALIIILAQIGSFVPADRAKIGIIDKMFSRIGAGDDLSRGQSTFMVEMLETSAILSQSTSRSLIILDEVGRGTSTYDGVAIAWAVLEHIHDKIKAKCLFATHYHELTQMENILPALSNYTVAIDESDERITFLHRIIKGAADKSYGIHVAQLAGLPNSVIKRASDLLKKLEKEGGKSRKEAMKNESINMSLFDV